MSAAVEVVTRREAARNFARDRILSEPQGPCQTDVVVRPETVDRQNFVASLPFSDFEIGAPPLPIDQKVVEQLMVSISECGQTEPITVRCLSNGRLRMLSGWHRTTALQNLGRTAASALIVSGLSDRDARLWQLVDNLHRKVLCAIDRARHDFELLQALGEKVSQGAIPLGGRQPSEKFHAKAAALFGTSADRMARSAKIAQITPEAELKIRELKLHDNQSALLKIADAGDTADLQIAKALELYARPKGKRVKEPVGTLPAVVGTTSTTAITSAPADGGGSEMPDIPLFLKRNRLEIGYDRLKEEWERCDDLLGVISAADPAARRRFLDECVMPTLFPPAAATAVAEEVLV
jgi:ParB-like chromosome segregation protein Spo0J